MNPIRLGAVAAVLFVALTAFFYFLQNGFRFVQPQKAYTHLHCPECQLEMGYTTALDGKSCPQCGNDGPALIPTVGPKRGAAAVGDIGPFGKLLGAGFIALLITLAFVYGSMLRYRARQQAERQVQNRRLVCRCPFCSRRIGYLAKQHGTCATCPRCKTAFPLTEGEERENASDPCP